MQADVDFGILGNEEQCCGNETGVWESQASSKSLSKPT
jgi:hypothetical protein